MTSTQFVNYAGRGFWAYNVALGVFLKHLIDAAEAHRNVDADWLSNAVADWRRVACISDYGLKIDSDWSTEQMEVFVTLVEHACARLTERDAIPSHEIQAWPILEDLRIFARGVAEVETAPVVELGRAIIALVRGGLSEAPHGRNWFFGTPTGRSTL